MTTKDIEELLERLEERPIIPPPYHEQIDYSYNEHNFDEIYEFLSNSNQFYNPSTNMEMMMLSLSKRFARMISTGLPST